MYSLTGTVIDENTDKYYESLEATLNVSIPISRKPQQILDNWNAKVEKNISYHWSSLSSVFTDLGAEMITIRDS